MQIRQRIDPRTLQTDVQIPNWRFGWCFGRCFGGFWRFGGRCFCGFWLFGGRCVGGWFCWFCSQFGWHGFWSWRFWCFCWFCFWRWRFGWFGFWRRLYGFWLYGGFYSFGVEVKQLSFSHLLFELLNPE